MPCRVPVFRCLARLGGLLLAALSFAMPARADLIVSDYKTGATFLPGVADIGADINYVFSFYGVERDTIFLSTNGNLNYSPSTAFNNTTFPTGQAAIIAPLWDSWQPPNDTSVSYRVDADKLVSTWSVVHYDDAKVKALFQAVLYKDGVIGFGYDAIDNSQITTRGLNKGDGVTNADGSIFNEAQSNTQRWYRFDSASGNYQTFNTDPRPVPELGLPVSLSGLLALTLYRRRRKSSPQSSPRNARKK